MDEFGKAKRYNECMTDNALRIIRELIRSQSIASVGKISESNDSIESLTSVEIEILDDGTPLTDDERFSRVRLEEAQRLSRIAQS